MNRNQRRAAQKSTPHTAPQRVSLQDIANQAVKAQTEGDWGTAQRLVEKLYAAEPTNPDVIHFLGVVALGQQNFTRAESYVEQALAIRQEGQYWRTLVQIHTAQANKDKAQHAAQKLLALYPADNLAGIEEAASLLLNNGNFTEALEQYQRILAADTAPIPQWGILFNIGQCYEQLGQHKEAEAHYTRAFAVHQDFVPLVKKIAFYAKKNGNVQQAEQYYQQCVALNPKNLEAWVALIDFYTEENNPQKAEDALLKAMTALPQQAELHHCYARLLVAQQRWNEAIIQNRFAVQFNPSNIHYYIQQAETFTRVCFTCYDPAAAQDLLRLFALQYISHQLIVAPTISLLEQLPPLQELLARANENEAEFIACLQQQQYQTAIHHPLLLMMLQTVFIGTLPWEKLFTLLRKQSLLCSSQQMALSIDGLIALSHQCYLNEYVYSQTPEEDAAVVALKTRSEQQKSPTILDAVLLSCYMPLSALRNRDAIEKAGQKAGQKSSLSVQGLFKRHITDPKHEAALRKSIPVLTPIENSISQAVRTQYEENPYPRWDAIHKIKAVSPAAHLQMIAPFLTAKDFAFGEKVSILIAGCGTGQQVAHTAQQYKNSDVLAVDLSLASLSYAKRKITEIGLKNVTLAQADILQLETLNQQFDIVESTGVLHHLENPMQGWHVLRRLVKPQGYMCIALYSTRARIAVKQARTMIAEKGFANTPEGIRACRQQIITQKSTVAGVHPLHFFRDFYSLSMCRDLLFHVQEHTFTVAEIASALEELNLEFIAFMFPENIKTKALYCEMFPEDTTLQNLENWEVFEQEHPSAFACMYQMVLRAKEA